MMDPGPLPVWLVVVVVALALGGLWHLCWAVHDAVVAAWGWLRSDRVTPLLDEPGPTLRQALAHELPLLGLPPERSAGELGFTGEQPAVAFQLRYPVELDGALSPGEIADLQERYGVHRERRAPWWEAEHRAAYHALGLDYPSGLLARVREAGR